MKSLNKVYLFLCALFALLLLGTGNALALNATISENGTNDWSGLNKTTNTVTWPGVHVTFTISGGPYSLDDDHLLMYKNRTMIISWDVDDDYTINVTKVTMKGYSTLEGYMTVGTKPSGNLYSFTQSNSTFDSQDLSLSNDDNLTAVTSAPDSRATFFHIREVTITYTIEGEEQTVTYDGTEDWMSGKNIDAPFNKVKTHVTFQLLANMKKYNYDYDGLWVHTHDHYFYLDKNNSSRLIWTVDEGYTINVKSIYFKAKRGKGYVYTSRMSQGSRKTFDQEAGSWVETTFSVDDASNNLFLLDATPTALGNTEYFNIDATTAEVDIEKINLTYTISPKTYTVSLDSEGGSDGSENVTLTFDSNAHDEIINPTKDGCTFDGWYSGDNGTGSLIIAADGTLQENTIYTGANGVWKKDDDDVTLYAKWSGVEYSVRFNKNDEDATGSMSNQAFTYGNAQNLTANGFMKSCTITYDANGGDAVASSVTSFAFSGWATTSAGAVAYENEEEVNNLTSTSGATVDLYAKWSAEADSVKLPMPKNDGFAFVGWYDANEDSIGTAGDTIAPTGNMTLKAHWRPGVGLTKNSITAGGDIVVTTEHVRFTMHSDGYGIVSGDDGGFKVWDDMPTNTTKNVTLTWEKTLTNGSYDITVTRITFKAKAYNSNYFNSQYGQMSFNGGSDFCIGTNSPYADKGWSDQIGGEGTYSSGVIIQLHNTKDVGPTQTFDYHFKDFQIEYTITPHTPNASNTDLAGTLSLEAKQTVDVSTLFSLDHPASDFEYTYRLKEAYSNAGMDGTNFYATRSGDYEVQCCVASGDDHEASAWSTATIHVTRTCVFDNGKRAGDKDWQKTTNWDYGVKPDGTDAVRVIGDLTIDEAISVYSLSIEDTAIVNIAPEGGLTVGEGGITGATTSNLFLRASDGTDGGEKGKTGYLRVSPSYTGAMPNASVELFSEAYYDPTLTGDNAAAWQCVGAPIANSGIKAKTVYTQSWIYSWVESADDWVNNRKNLEFSPFVGYITTQDTHTEGTRLTYTGQLVSGAESVVIDLAKSGDGKGHNFLANSFAAPIDISLFDVADFYHATPTIYIRNAGTRRSSLTENQLSQSKAQAAAPGQYLAIPVTSATDLAASFDYPIVIPSMQGFWVDATDDDGTVTLNYNNLVWSADYSTHSNAALRAPKHADNEGESSQVGSLQISITADGWYDNVFMLESSRYEAAYEPGSDALKKTSGNLNIFALTENNEQLSIHATDSIIGTRIGVRTGTETAYTLIFSNIKNDAEMALWDAETQQSYAIYEGMEYTFFAEPDTIITERFKIVEYAAAPSVTTGVDQTQTETKVHKFVKDDQIFILKNGVLYNAVGVRVK